MEQTDCASTFRAIYYEVYQVSAFKSIPFIFKTIWYPLAVMFLGRLGIGDLGVGDKGLGDRWLPRGHVPHL
jgi:hypothetical protein